MPTALPVCLAFGADITVDATSSRADPADATWQRQGHHGIALVDCHAVLVERWGCLTSVAPCQPSADMQILQCRASYSFQLIPASMPLPILNNRFRIGYRYYHDLAVTDGSLLNVFTAGSGFDLNVHTQAGKRAPSQRVPPPLCQCRSCPGSRLCPWDLLPCGLLGGPLTSANDCSGLPNAAVLQETLQTCSPTWTLAWATACLTHQVPPVPVRH